MQKFYLILNLREPSAKGNHILEAIQDKSTCFSGFFVKSFPGTGLEVTLQKRIISST